LVFKNTKELKKPIKTTPPKEKKPVGFLNPGFFNPAYNTIVPSLTVTNGFCCCVVLWWELCYRCRWLKGRSLKLSHGP